jgi:hypothetical protein
MVTLRPLACSNLASDAAIIPLPSEEVTPPVTKMYFAIFRLKRRLPSLRDTKLRKNHPFSNVSVKKAMKEVYVGNMISHFSGNEALKTRKFTMA